MVAVLRGRALQRGLAALACVVLIGTAEARIIKEPTIADPPVVEHAPSSSFYYDFYVPWSNVGFQSGAAWNAPWLIPQTIHHDIWNDVLNWRMATWNQRRRPVQNAVFFTPVRSTAFLPLNAFTRVDGNHGRLPVTQGFGDLGWHNRR